MTCLRNYSAPYPKTLSGQLPATGALETNTTLSRLSYPYNPLKRSSLHQQLPPWYRPRLYLLLLQQITKIPDTANGEDEEDEDEEDNSIRTEMTTHKAKQEENPHIGALMQNQVELGEMNVCSVRRDTFKEIVHTTRERKDSFLSLKTIEQSQ